jgi:hypothetical protein
MSKGGRTASRPTKSDRFEQMAKQVENLTMAVRVGQMMSQRMAQQLNSIVENLTINTGMLNDFQYRALAMQQLAGVDKSQLQAITDQLKLADFDKESEAKDQAGGFLVVDKVEGDDDTVLITSFTPDEKEDKGILRSRIKISDMNQADLQAKLVGCVVGSKVEATLNGVNHVIEILGIRRAAPVPAEAEVIKIG